MAVFVLVDEEPPFLFGGKLYTSIWRLETGEVVLLEEAW